MNEYKISYKLEGDITIKADSEQEAKDELYSLSDSAIINNCYMGIEITDIRQE